MQALTQETPDAQGGGEYFARVALANVQLKSRRPASSDGSPKSAPPPSCTIR